MDIPTAMQLT